MRQRPRRPKFVYINITSLSISRQSVEEAVAADFGHPLRDAVRRRTGQAAGRVEGAHGWAGAVPEGRLGQGLRRAAAEDDEGAQAGEAAGFRDQAVPVSGH